MSRQEAYSLARKAWNAWRKESDPQRKAELLKNFQECRSKLREVQKNESS